MSKLNSTGSLNWMSEPRTKYDDTTLSETEHWTDSYSLSLFLTELCAANLMVNRSSALGTG